MATGNDNLIKASFNPLIRPYLVLYGAFILFLTVIGIPFALIWVLGLGQWWSGHYFRRLRCELSDTELRFRKGILFQVEKTIPLENIQDVTFIEGPLLRQFQLSILKFETAGQSVGQAHSMQLIGIVEADDFRQQILQRRRQLRSAHAGAAGTAGSPSDQDTPALLREIAESVRNIERLLRERN